MRLIRAGRIWQIVLVSIVLTTVLFVPAPRAFAAGTAVFTITTPAAPVTPGSQFSVSVSVQPNNAIAGAQFDLSFNPSLATITSVVEGNLLKQAGANTYFASGTINNTSGTLTGVSCVIISPGQSVSNSGTLATITFTAGSTKGISALNLTNLLVGDVNAQSLPVSGVNGSVSLDRAPVLNPIGAKSTGWGSALSFNLSGSDGDGDSLTYSATNLPSGATFTPSSRTFSWTPTAGQIGSYPNVHFQVSDGTLSDSEDITISVTKLSPSFSSLSSPTINFASSPTALSGNLKAGSQVPTGNVSITLNGVTQTAAIQSNGNFSSSFNTAALSSAGSPYIISYSFAGDSGFNSASDSSKTLVVNGVAASVTLSNLNQTYDGTPRSATATTNPSGLTVAITYNGSSTVPSSSGSYAVVATITSPNYSGSASGTLTIARASPAFSNLSAPTIAYGTSNTSLGGNLKAGSLVPGGSVSITLNGTTQTASLDGSGNFSASFSTGTFSTSGSPYTVSYSYSGNGNFNAASDSSKTLTVTNQAPVLAAVGNKTAVEGQALTITLSASDADGNTLTYSASNLPSGASFNAASRTFSWTPTHAQVGTYSGLHFQVSDGLLSDSEDINVTVAAVYANWDVNHDGAVNVLDMSLVGQHWGETGSAGWIAADASQDGAINTLDLILIGQHWTG